MDHSTVHRQLSFLYSPQSSSSIGASWTAAGSRAITSRSTPQSEQTMISPTSVPASSLIWASHSGQDTVDIVYTPLILQFQVFAGTRTVWYQTSDLAFPTTGVSG